MIYCCPDWQDFRSCLALNMFEEFLHVRLYWLTSVTAIVLQYLVSNVDEGSISNTLQRGQDPSSFYVQNEWAEVVCSTPVQVRSECVVIVCITTVNTTCSTEANVLYMIHLPHILQEVNMQVMQPARPCVSLAGQAGFTAAPYPATCSGIYTSCSYRAHIHALPVSLLQCHSYNKIKPLICIHSAFIRQFVGPVTIMCVSL
jgi:hypothetical protein